jgi:hypothetical protein
VPLTIASFATLDSRFWPEAMAIFHLLRNIGSSFFHFALRRRCRAGHGKELQPDD